jgi:uncharacterized protein (DUF2147 family)
MPNCRPTLRRVAGAALLALTAAPAAAADDAALFGRWLTEDRKGVVEFYPCGAEVCGKIVWYDESDSARTDVSNPDPALRSRAVCALQILGGFKPAAGKREWTDGWIYAPKSGKTYTAQMAIEEPGKLRLRGYVGIPLFGETQVWTPDPDPARACRRD